MQGRLFEDLVVSRGGAPARTTGGMPLSFVIHAVGIAGLLALSVVLPEEMPVPPSSSIADVVFASAPRVPAAPGRPQPAARNQPPQKHESMPLLRPPQESAELVPDPFDPAPAPGDDCPGCVVGNEGPGGPGGPGGEIGGDPSGTSAPIAISAPVRVGGHIQPPRKIRHVDPVYPELARRAGVTGIVILECVIGPEGRIRSVSVLRGQPLLDAAAMDAVRQWAYRPTLLNGVAVEIVMTVTVRFTTR